MCFANTKGGVGKSTLAVHLAVWLHRLGHRVALIDGDKQRSSSTWMAEAEKGITVAAVSSPEECVAVAQSFGRNHDIVVADGPAGIDDISRTLLVLAERVFLPITPSILDLRSVQQACAILKYAQGINGGRPSGRLILNKFKKRESISRELMEAARQFGVSVANQPVRDLQAYRDAAQQGTVVGRLGKRGAGAAQDLEALFQELVGDLVRVESKAK